ncbi:MAG: helicase C-terminal domain-containing protein [Anaerolineales bacterium]
MQTLVSLDIETTGLDPVTDAIIEIGAVRFRDSRQEDEWTRLVNPGRPLSRFITQLTGITDEMLSGAPRINEVLESLEAFVSEDPIVGHRVEFDLSFLRRRGLFGSNLPLDTYDLAAVVLPDAGRYSLGALASLLKVPSMSAHRALDDAKTTMHVFRRLYEHVMELPYPLLKALSEMAQPIDWGAGWVFEAAMDERIESGEKVPENGRLDFSSFATHPTSERALMPLDEPAGIDIEELASLIEPGGALSHAIEGYENRTQQVQMLKAVGEALAESRHLLVEAGTGTGKSMAYLIPSLEWAMTTGLRVLISTNTINLQDQLVHKDVPDLQAALGKDYKAAVLKGRRNYLCPRRLSAMARIGPRNAEEARILAKVLVWLIKGGTGDVSEINIRGPVEAAIWSRLSSDYEECSLEACLQHTGGTCPYYRSRREAEGAHVVIVNHALLLADIATGNRVIPDYEYLVIDEGHHLEAATTRGLRFDVTEADLNRVLRELSGATTQRVLQLAKETLPAEQFVQFQPIASTVAEAAREAQQLTARFFKRLLEFMDRRRDGRPVGRYGQQERILPSTRTLPFWSEVEIGWDELRSPLSKVLDSLQGIVAASEGIGERAIEAPAEGLLQVSDAGLSEDLAVSLRALAGDLGEIIASLDELIFQADPQRIYWLELQSEPGRLSMHAAPLEVGPLVEKYLWHEKESVIITSATLTTAGEFDYIRRRLSATEADELALGSPFDYESSTMLYLINDIPEPQERRAYQAAFERGLISLCRATGGRALVLFTSNQQLMTTARAISAPLASEGIVVLEQSAGASRHALLENFRSTEQAVLLGSRSFWEGVDIPGDALSVLAIARLPFDVPSDPIIAARAETYENSFGEYSLPEAILRFRQGFGRLIRTRSDRGIVVSFDSRLLTKSYGRAFIHSLPNVTQRIGPMNDLPGQAARWLGI